MARRPIAVLVLAAAIVACVVYVYAPVRHFDFVSFDDPDYVAANPHIAAGLTWATVAWALTTGYVANWHPLTWLSHAVDLQLFGLNAGAHHDVSVALHLLNSLLLFAVLVRMTASTARSAVVALLFAVHPLHVESVAWIAERKDVLSGTFFVLTLWLYASYVRRPGVGRYAAVCVAFALGLMAKPMLVTLPFVLLLVDVWPLDRPNRPLLKEKIPLFVLAAASSVVTFLVQRDAGAVQELGALSLGSRISQACVSYVTYLWQTIWPAGLSVFYPAEPIAAWATAGAVAILLTLTVVAIRARSKVPYLLVGWLWFVGTLVPVIGLIQVGIQAHADRYTYIPLIGLFIIVVWGAGDVARRFGAARTRIAVTVAAALVVVMLCARARTQVMVWSDSTALWTHALQVTPKNVYAEAGIGAELAEQGKTDEAIAHLTAALRVLPTLSDVRNNLGRMYVRRGDVPAAIEQFRAAVRSSPDFADARHNLGVSLLDQGHFDEAIAQFAEATRLNPFLAEAYNSWGRALLEQGHLSEAIAKLEQALGVNPRLADAHQNLGRALAMDGRVSDAVPHFRSAIQLQPDFAEAHHNLGLALATVGQLDAAIAEFAESIRLEPALADPAGADQEYAKALAAFNAGQLDAAGNHARGALASNPAHIQARALLEKIKNRT